MNLLDVLFIKLLDFKKRNQKTLFFNTNIVEKQNYCASVPKFQNKFQK